MNSAQPILYHLDYHSPLDDIRLISNAHAVIAAYFTSRVSAQEARLYAGSLPASTAEQQQLFYPVTQWLQQYFTDPGSVPALPVITVILAGTRLQKTVWRALCTIETGYTISYSELALRCGRPDAVRAIASACGKNPLPILIPCHRVIAKSGQLGGYTGGLDIKKWLLEWESHALANPS